jgi:hypothetical protein
MPLQCGAGAWYANLSTVMTPVCMGGTLELSERSPGSCGEGLPELGDGTCLPDVVVY